MRSAKFWRPLRSLTGSNVRRKFHGCLTFAHGFSVMLYANTLMTVATICHVRKQGVWLRTVAELPTFGAPALTFGSKSDEESPFMIKVDESEVPILGGSGQSMDARTPYHFRTRIPFLLHPPTQTGTLSTAPSPPPTSLVPTAAIQSDLARQNTGDTSSTGHHITPTGEPPTYSNYEHVVV